MSSFSKQLLIVALALAAGCSTPKVQTMPVDRIAGLHLPLSIKNGVTTREQALLRLGTPSMQFEGLRILTYRIGIDKHGTAQVLPPQGRGLPAQPAEQMKEEYSLVLVFGPNGILERHSLVGTT